MTSVRIEAVVWVGDDATVRDTIGHHVAWQIDWNPGPVANRWDALHAEAASKLVTLRIDPELSVAEFGRLALRESGRQVAAARIWLEDAVTAERLPDEAMLLDHVDDGDLVLVKVLIPSSVDRLMLSLPDPEKLFTVLHAAAALEVVAWPRLWGAMLYTEEDVDVATYVRTHFDELNAASGDLLRIFVVERPTDWRRAKRYWRPRLEQSLLRTLSVLRWLTWTPYDKAGLYDVAREIGVDPAMLPCLVLFGGTENDRIIFPITSADPAGFRELFGTIHRAVGDAPSTREPLPEVWNHQVRNELVRGTRATDALRALAASSSWADREALARVESAKHALLATDLTGHNVIVAHGSVHDLTFTGPTTFINKPVNTVIQDFQNTYSGKHSDLLTELLSLALNGENLLPEDRVELARRVTRLAESVGSGWFSSAVDAGLFRSEGPDAIARVKEILSALRKDLRW